ncbi:2-oxoglutarate (2OG) and Fe(II)-dependent oxygenase superfamily protein [Quillaja saponaria]|uniref:2-oxoglutarate (2OG) and Fe(II)-dependent oxygenase superfamily protein n=1 Tax=Quillaja saponaria TaxID=32244 RepID=A0AAD7L3N8_QUISA|nr:2-oxoglutarate (2OG) and Fe(II)-dependent oxygenase superfamily protein [Quillaja saponaria]
MGMGEERSNASFTSAMTLEQSGVSSIPQSYVLPPSQRPNHNLNNISATLPIIDLSSLQDQSQRSQTVNSIRTACKEIGFFQVINHGIHESVMKDALDAAMGFFDLPTEEKMVLASDNVNEPVRYGTSINHVRDAVYFWRDFIKHYSHPISDWIPLWPSHPPNYKEKMGNYAKAVLVLQKQLMEIIIESLGLNPTYLQEEIKEGSQVLVVNCYPACPEPELTLGLPPHSDYGSITILLESHRGLQIQDHNNNWIPVQVSEKALMVQLGDQVEVMSNGQYKSVIHRVTVNPEEKRFSIASIHSLALEIKVGPASELVDEEHPKSYNQFSFRDFLDFITSNDTTGGRFIDTLKKP